MSDLDDKLQRILYEHRNDPPIGEQTALIDDIIQAFADAEYCSFIKYPTEGSHRMTGQEWYDRFEKELGRPDVTPVIVNPPTKDSILLTAKRASGLTGTDK